MGFSKGKTKAELSRDTLSSGHHSYTQGGETAEMAWIDTELHKIYRLENAMWTTPFTIITNSVLADH